MLTAVLLIAFIGGSAAMCAWPPCPTIPTDANSVVSDSCVHLMAVPDVVEKDITKDLELRCEYSGSDPVVSIGIGKKENGNTRGLAYIVSSSPSDTTWTAPELKGVVHGAIDGTNEGRNKSYIGIKWMNPAIEHSGSYVCLVSEIPSFGAVRTKQSSVYVRGTGVTEQRLLRRLEKLEAELEAVKVKLDSEKKSMKVVQEALFTETSTFQNRTYYLSEYLPGSYVKADAVCQSLGGYLAEIDNRAEYDFVVRFLAPRLSTQVVVLIAGSDEGHTGKWVIQRTNKTVDFLDWWPGEPNGLGSEHRLSLMNNRQGPGVHMNNMYYPFIPWLEYHYQYGFLCEVPNKN